MANLYCKENYDAVITTLEKTQQELRELEKHAEKVAQYVCNLPLPEKQNYYWRDVIRSAGYILDKPAREELEQS